MGTQRFRSTCRVLAIIGAVAVCLAARRAEAADSLRLSVDWGKLSDVLLGTSALLPREGEAWRPAAGPEQSNATVEPPWIGTRPNFSLVARDWGGSQLLVGRLTLTDQLRLSRSIRMVVTRVRLSNGRLAPFAHVGLGQWRVDTSLLPAVPADEELAGQLGGGFELALGARASIAIEADWTLLYRERYEPRMVSSPQLWGTFLASRFVF